MSQAINHLSWRLERHSRTHFRQKRRPPGTSTINTEGHGPVTVREREDQPTHEARCVFSCPLTRGDVIVTLSSIFAHAPAKRSVKLNYFTAQRHHPRRPIRLEVIEQTESFYSLVKFSFSVNLRKDMWPLGFCFFFFAYQDAVRCLAKTNTSTNSLGDNKKRPRRWKKKFYKRVRMAIAQDADSLLTHRFNFSRRLVDSSICAPYGCEDLKTLKIWAPLLVRRVEPRQVKAELHKHVVNLLAFALRQATWLNLSCDSDAQKKTSTCVPALSQWRDKTERGGTT